MKLISARVLGFQSFRDSGEIEFADGINLLVGQNNAGKSALLRALQPVLTDDRHRSPDRWATYHLAAPSVQLIIDLAGDELRNGVLRFGEQRVPILAREPDPPGFLANLWQLPSVKLKLSRAPGASFAPRVYPSHGLYLADANSGHACVVASPSGGEVNSSGIQHTPDDTLPTLATNIWLEDMFFFNAERFALGESGHGHANRLSPNAQNLPTVLHTLSGTRGSLFQKLVAHLREIFSTVGNLSVGPTPGGALEVRVWPTEAMERVELSFPLNSSGTGVSQVIALLTAIMTVENAVLIIDEINSFLHPAAVKALLRILQTEYPHHQYIISTHAPEVIGFSNPRTVHLVKRDGYESSVVKLDLGQVDAFREVADHLGVSMADVFAADRVVWVEGPTEELCFPLLYQQATNRPLPRGTIFTSVMATGDFMAKRRDKELVYQIYRRLSQVAVPLVVSVAFSFDSENLTGPEREKMVQDSQGAMRFLPRRHIECYLVNADAIATFIAERDSQTPAIETGAVIGKLTELAGDEKFKIDEWSGDLTEAAWLAKVDAANLIADVCASLSEHRVTFNKKDDTLALLQQVQMADFTQLAELADYVRSLVDAEGAPK